MNYMSPKAIIALGLASVLILISAQEKKQNGKIAFVKEAGKAKGLYIADGDGKNEKKLSEIGNWDKITRLEWSPDGRKIAFIVDVRWEMKDLGGQYDLCVIDEDGQNLIKILQSTSSTLFFEWLPNGKIAYSGKGYFYAIDPDGENEEKLFKKLAKKRFFGGYVSSPDGKIALATGSSSQDEIYVADKDGKNIKKLCMGLKPVWAPDGKRILFQRNVFNEDKATGDAELYTIDATGKNEKKLTKFLIWGPLAYQVGWHKYLWSPDGKWIVFTLKEKDGENICTIGADGKNEKNLTKDLAGRSGDPTLSPDGTKILFVHLAKKSSRAIYIMNADGSNKKKIIEGVNPAWQPITK